MANEEPVCECGHGLLSHLHLAWEAGHVVMHSGGCMCPCLAFIEDR